MKIDVVLGLGYGDEGKGNVVNALATQDSLVIRFNGGTQAGHTAVHKGVKHIFSGFGSGTLKGAKTYISSFCAIDPQAIMKEYRTLRKKGIKPESYINGNTMIITPYDINENRMKLGGRTKSVGVGFGTTIQRNEDNVKLYARDLLYPEIFGYKLDRIRHYYGTFTGVDSFSISKWMKSAYDMIKKVTIVNTVKEIPFWWRHIIFEGAQGIMLDMDYGFFPHVTRSNTTSKNVYQFIRNEIGISPEYPRDFTTYYVTRTYATRHGDGPLLYAGKYLDIKKNENETNVTNKYQGKLRYAPLNMETMKYAIDCNNTFNHSPNETLVITCFDHTKTREIEFINKNGVEDKLLPTELAKELNLPNVIVSATDSLKI